MLTIYSDATRTVTTYDEHGQPTGTRDYTDEENAAADAEQAAQEAEAAAEARAVEDAAILDAVRATSVPASADGEPWVQPTGAHDAYPLGAERTHGGKTWVSLVPFNVWEPGTSGWREVTSDTPAPWVQPTGAHDAYPAGARVTHQGQTWTSDVDGNVWEPGAYGWTAD